MPPACSTPCRFPMSCAPTKSTSKTSAHPTVARKINMPPEQVFKTLLTESSRDSRRKGRPRLRRNPRRPGARPQKASTRLRSQKASTSPPQAGRATHRLRPRSRHASSPPASPSPPSPTKPSSSTTSSASPPASAASSSSSPPQTTSAPPPPPSLTTPRHDPHSKPVSSRKSVLSLP